MSTETLALFGACCAVLGGAWFSMVLYWWCNRPRTLLKFPCVCYGGPLDGQEFEETREAVATAFVFGDGAQMLSAGYAAAFRTDGEGRWIFEYQEQQHHANTNH